MQQALLALVQDAQAAAAMPMVARNRVYLLLAATAGPPPPPCPEPRPAPPCAALFAKHISALLIVGRDAMPAVRSGADDTRQLIRLAIGTRSIRCVPTEAAPWSPLSEHAQLDVK